MKNDITFFLLVPSIMSKHIFQQKNNKTEDQKIKQRIENINEEEDICGAALQ